MLGERDRELPPEFGSKLLGTGDGTVDPDSCRENKLAIVELESKFGFDEDFEIEISPGFEIGICDCVEREFDQEHGFSVFKFGDKIFGGKKVVSVLKFSLDIVGEFKIEFEFEIGRASCRERV